MQASDLIDWEGMATLALAASKFQGLPKGGITANLEGHHGGGSG